MAHLDTDSTTSEEEEDDEEAFIFEILYSCSEISSFEKTPQKFVPIDAIDRVFAYGAQGMNVSPDPRQRVLKLLGKDSNAEEEGSLLDFIVTRAKKLFLICIRTHQSNIHTKMTMFMEQNFDDGQLPIKSVRSTKPADTPDDHPFFIMNKAYAKGKRRRLWKIMDIEIFLDYQWMFLAPIISTTALLQDFGQRTMPFISSETPPSFRGTFSIVTRYEVHHAHIDNAHETPPSSRIIAVKEFKKSQEDTTSQWENEVRVLEKIRCFRHDHIVRFITAFRRGEGQNLDHYICFEWASGGNLADFWEADPQPRLSAPLLQAIIIQLHGLAQALETIHYFKGSDGMSSGESLIHGDIKPRNILWFKGNGEIGTLKLADWGEAKAYGSDADRKANTATRNNTTGKFGTRRYEPPEVETGMSIQDSGTTKTGRSRLYDTWSFGCFTLEFIIWILHGTEGLKLFRIDNVGDYSLSDSFYEINQKRLAKVHGVVSHWMDHLERDAICQSGASALGDLLDIVRNGLLVVALPEGGGSIQSQVTTYPRFKLLDLEQAKRTDTEPVMDESSIVGHAPDAEDGPLIHITIASKDEETADGAKYSTVLRRKQRKDSALSAVDLERFRAVELVENLGRIARREQSDSYWYQDLPRCPIPPKFRDRISQISSKIPPGMRGNYDLPYLDPEDWQLRSDNDFAAEMFERLTNAGVLGPSSPIKVTEHLCKKCQEFRRDLWSPFFTIIYETNVLHQNSVSHSCDLCALLWQVCQDYASSAHSSVSFERRDSTLRMSNGRLPVLSLFRDHDAQSVVNDIQTGFSELSDAGSALHLEILRCWLDHCDHKHWKDPKCKPSRFKKSAAGSIIKLPTRLIDVGTADNSCVRLQDMKDLDGDWIALSYQWGTPPYFSTTRHNMRDMYAGVEVDTLPQTFRDAIKITRALGRRYLWIDSICIIQGPDGDFESEARTMEDVYNGAYCVLAACCAKDQSSGFLLPRMARLQVTLDPQHDNYGAIYVCQRIENFDQHVLHGDLAKRGWVLQEHALARRTIFFTEYQTYWECGHGVRCETMATLANDHASLLGDPDFPKRLEPAEHGEFVVRLQELLRQYSRLGLSKDHDRSTAISGLQQRLMRVMNLQGGYGTFDSSVNPGLLRRSLLWHRSLEVSSLATITYPKHYEVPSWSWMSCSGPIDYFPLTFYGFDWQDLNLTWSDTKVADGKTRLGATVQNLDLTAANPFEADIIFDIPAKVDEQKIMAVVLGVEKGEAAPEDKTHYILVVTSKEAWGHSLYGRVGAGHVPGRCLVGQPDDCLLI